MFSLSGTERSRRVLSSALWTAIATLVVLGLGAGTASAEKRKIEICHKGNVISVDVHAVPAHLEHGDRLGNCEGTGPCGPCSFIFDPVTCADGTTYANQCFADCNNAPGPCTRLGVCSQIFDPVLCDGVIYDNECVARNAGCTTFTRLCVCPQIYAPVRCSDGTIYVNACVAQCRGASGCADLGP
jgi:hypothetical protein